MTINELSLNSRIAKLKEYAKIIAELRKKYSRKQFLSEDMIKRYIERYLQLALEAVIDVSDHIISQQGLRKPEEYRDSILILGEAKILPKKFAEKFAPAAGFRNILVHDYLRLNPEKVFIHFQEDSKDIDKFLKYIVKFLEG